MKTTQSSSSDPSSAIVLRHDLQPGDLGRLIHLHGIVRAREHGFDATFEADMAAQLAEIAQSLNNGDRLWIAERAGQLVGCIAIVGLSPRDAELRWFLVDPAVRGLGLEERLLGEAIAFRRCRGYEYVFLWAPQSAGAAAELYHSAGFRKVGQRRGRRWGVEVVEDKYALRPSKNPASGGGG
ncbi:MAG TPA: GNAT family N-acetyltransferase, partial [Gemmataceae bacterium]